MWEGKGAFIYGSWFCGLVVDSSYSVSLKKNS